MNLLILQRSDLVLLRLNLAHEVLDEAVLLVELFVKVMEECATCCSRDAVCWRLELLNPLLAKCGVRLNRLLLFHTLWSHRASSRKILILVPKISLVLRRWLLLANVSSLEVPELAVIDGPSHCVILGVRQLILRAGSRELPLVITRARQAPANRLLLRSIGFHAKDITHSA